MNEIFVQFHCSSSYRKDLYRNDFVWKRAVSVINDSLSLEGARNPRGILGLIFAGYVPLASQSPYPIIVYSVANYRTPSWSLWANMLFSRSQLSHFLFLWIDPFFYIDWRTLYFFICGTNIRLRLLTVNMKNCLTPKNPKMCDPILVTLLKTRPHYSQSSRENATPSSGTSPLASYKEVPHPPGP